MKTNLIIAYNDILGKIIFWINNITADIEFIEA